MNKDKELVEKIQRRGINRKRAEDIISLCRQHEWILTSENPPPDDRLVHTCFPSLSGGYVQYDGWLEDDTWSYIGCFRNEAPEYWMPRAEPPKEESDE